MNKCPKCGTEYEGNFCPNGCNAPVQNTAQAQPKKKNGCLIAAIIVAIVAVVIIGIVVTATALFAKGVSEVLNETVGTMQTVETSPSKTKSDSDNKTEKTTPVSIDDLKID